MTLPAYPNAISFSQIRTGFSTSVTKFSDLYEKDAGPVYPGQVGYPYGVSTQVPTSGTIRISNFSGATPYTPIFRTDIINIAMSGTWTVPDTLISNITVLVVGGGGGGAGWPSQAGGGGGGGGSRWVGRPASGTAISYTVGAGGARGPGGTSGSSGSSSTFGTSGQSWYLVATGGGGGVASRSGSDYAAGGTGNYGTGGNGSSVSGATPAGNAVTLGGGGGAYDGSTSAGTGAGASAAGTGNGGPYRTNGYVPGGGGGGGDTGTGGNGANGAIIISGYW